MTWGRKSRRMYLLCLDDPATPQCILRNTLQPAITSGLLTQIHALRHSFLRSHVTPFRELLPQLSGFEGGGHTFSSALGSKSKQR